jgi:acylphosphatase
MVRKHVFVIGRVQGVAFRASARKEALSLGLSGWIRNRRDRDRVEIKVEGDEESVGRFLTWCESGSRFSRVSKVEVSDDEDAEPLPEFTVVATV